MKPATEGGPPGPSASVDLRVMVITHAAPAAGSTLDVVRRCVEAGAGAVQLRDKSATDAALLDQALALADVVHEAGAVLIVNDRFDIALAAGADGVHVGPADLPIETIRLHCDEDFLVGFSTDAPVAGMLAAQAGADYLGVGAVYGTTSKDGLADEAVGPERVAAVLHSAGLPGVGIGGITPENAAPVFATGAGVAVLGAVMHSPDPAAVVARLLQVATEASPSEG